MRVLKPVLRWLLVVIGAAIGSYAGRVAAAALRGEPVQPLLRPDRVLVMRHDLVPGFVAVELLGRLLKLGLWGSGLVAAVAAAAAAFVDGPIVRDRRADEWQAASEPAGGPASAG
jgi:hypothetical protein